jgi:hypothetical protein
MRQRGEQNSQREDIEICNKVDRKDVNENVTCE